jgi:nucleoid DNA-binding protein
VISGGKLQTLAGGEIVASNGVLSGATIASGSIVDINNFGTLTLVDRIANLGLISALGSPNLATLSISGAVVLSGGGKVSLSPNGNNQIVAATPGAILSNVNNTIAGAGTIAGGLTVVNAGKLEATTSDTLILATNISNTSTGTILASGSGAHVALNGGAVISGGTLQTLAGGEIDANNGVLSGATIASGSIVDINNFGTLKLVDRIANLGLMSALGSPNLATLSISGAVVLSGGGRVSLSPNGNNQIVAATPGAILSNVNNTIAGAGTIAGGLTVVNAAPSTPTPFRRFFSMQARSMPASSRRRRAAARSY